MSRPRFIGIPQGLVAALRIHGTPLRQNVTANFIGRGWTTILGFVFVPLYLKFLGIEAYGLIGVFATLQGVFGLFDLGLGVTINRELARMAATPDRARARRDVLRTLESCYWVVSVLSGLVLFVLAGPIARGWLQTSALSPLTVERAIRLMAAVIALQLPFSLYQGALMGLERQVLLNAIVIVCGTLRSVGTALVLWRLSRTIEAFFICQLLVSVLQTGAAAAAAWRTVGGLTTARVRSESLHGVWRFAAAISGNTLVGIALTQLDKVLLSKLLPLEQFGYYALAGTVASVMWQPIIPINQALYPQFARLFESGQLAALTSLYHRACQLMSILLAPLAAILIFFSHDLILLWTHNPRAADAAWLVAALLVAGTTLNGLASLPGYLQSAAGWPQLVLYTNTLSAIALVPGIVVATARYGAVGAAAVWLLLNLGYVLFNVPMMHRRLLRGEQSRWYVEDVALPVAAAFGVVLALSRWRPYGGSVPLQAAFIAATWLAAAIAASAAAPRVRAMLRPSVAAV